MKTRFSTFVVLGAVALVAFTLRAPRYSSDFDLGVSTSAW